MADLCNTIITVSAPEFERLLPGIPLALALEPEQAEVVKGVVDIARKAGQVRGSRMTWSHKGSWFVFKNTDLGIMLTIEESRPEWAVAPPKAKLVPILVPEHLVQAMRLHLGGLVNA